MAARTVASLIMCNPDARLLLYREVAGLEGFGSPLQRDLSTSEAPRSEIATAYDNALREQRVTKRNKLRLCRPAKIARP